MVTVPYVVGMTLDDGHRLAGAAGVVLATPDPDRPAFVSRVGHGRARVD